MQPPARWPRWAASGSWHVCMSLGYMFFESGVTKGKVWFEVTSRGVKLRIGGAARRTNACGLQTWASAADAGARRLKEACRATLGAGLPPSRSVNRAHRARASHVPSSAPLDETQDPYPNRAPARQPTASPSYTIPKHAHRVQPEPPQLSEPATCCCCCCCCVRCRRPLAHSPPARLCAALPDRPSKHPGTNLGPVLAPFILPRLQRPGDEELAWRAALHSTQD